MKLDILLENKYARQLCGVAHQNGAFFETGWNRMTITASRYIMDPSGFAVVKS